MTTPTPEARTPRPRGPVMICVASKDYAFGDPRPPQERGYMEFMAWQEAQLRKQRRPETRP
ncbi:MAG: hypothetical protein HW395_58 [candidate division NC10 bacterium]|nr:hypothetical protein [candidate division NC10 bacterium]